MEPNQKQLLLKLTQNLLELGREHPNYLIFLTQVVQPTLEDTFRLPLLIQLFNEVPGIIQSASQQQLVQYFITPPSLPLTFQATAIPDSTTSARTVCPSGDIPF